MTALPKTKKPKKRTKRDYSKQADKLCGQLVRARGVCEAIPSPIACDGPLQWCHGFSRGYRAVRWDLRNGFCMCRSHHFWYTNHPEEWRDWMELRLGFDLYYELRGLALSGDRPDLPSLVASLKEQVAA